MLEVLATGVVLDLHVAQAAVVAHEAGEADLCADVGPPGREPGKFRAEFDNAFSYLRGKELTYHLRLLPKAAWAEERRKAELERLTAEVAARRAKHAELGDALKAHEAREAELKAALQATERAAAAARDHRERNKAALQAAQAQLKALQEEREPGAAAAER